MAKTPAYLRFFNFREHPFAPTADPAYFYATHAHRECLFRLWENIDARQGIAVVVGEAGTGKTTLLRKLVIGMAAQPDRYSAAIIGAPLPSWSSLALLQSIVKQFGLLPQDQSFTTLLDALGQCLVANRHRRCTLVVDDAQNLNKRGQLELLRLLQNLETQQRKLLNMVFFTQPDWDDVLHAAPNFEQRINITCMLEPVPFEETRNLVEFRLGQAGAENGVPHFEDTALRVIHAYAQGSARVIVTLCRNVLLMAAQLQLQSIRQDLVLQTIENTTAPDPERRTRMAAAILNSMRAGDGPDAETKPVVQDRSLVEQASRNERAASLLLKAARDRERVQGIGE